VKIASKIEGKLSNNEDLSLLVIHEHNTHGVPSGAETNLKVGGTGPEQNCGGTDQAQSAWKKICRAPIIFGSKSAISRFGERYRDGQHSLVSFFFAVLLLTVLPVPSHL